jgi:hypothetical protein
MLDLVKRPEPAKCLVNRKLRGIVLMYQAIETDQAIESNCNNIRHSFAKFPYQPNGIRRDGRPVAQLAKSCAIIARIYETSGLGGAFSASRITAGA